MVMVKRMSLIKEALSTRKVMQNLPPVKNIHYISGEELKELQNCFLEIIKDIDKVCMENNINYMAAGGTCLGAVRHTGFIPWDDDVDLIMPREDLKRFIDIFDRTLSDKYEITSPNTKYPLESLITAVYKKNTLKSTFQAMGTDLPKGVHIDIFPIESVPRNPIAQKVKGIIATGLQYIAVSTLFKHLTNEEKKNFFYQTKAGKINYRIRIFVASCFSFFSSKKWASIYHNFVSTRKDTGLWTVPTDIKHYFGHIMEKDVYFPIKRVPFENIEINVPNDTDQYLKNQYGDDYMTLPPVEKREKHWSIGFCLDLKDQNKQGE